MLVEVFDPVLGCASGVCGPRVDPVLVLFAADLRWLQENGCPVRRFNLGQSPAAFVQNETVRAELNRSGESALPRTLVDGRLVVLVSRPQTAPLREAERASRELAALGLTRQRLILNGVFQARDGDPLAVALQRRGEAALAAAGPRDAVLADRAAAEAPYLREVTGGLARRTAQVPWVPEEPVGPRGLRQFFQQPASP